MRNKERKTYDASGSRENRREEKADASKRSDLEETLNVSVVVESDILENDRREKVSKE